MMNDRKIGESAQNKNTPQTEMSSDRFKFEEDTSDYVRPKLPNHNYGGRPNGAQSNMSNTTRKTKTKEVMDNITPENSEQEHNLKNITLNSHNLVRRKVHPEENEIHCMKAKYCLRTGQEGAKKNENKVDKVHFMKEKDGLRSGAESIKEHQDRAKPEEGRMHRKSATSGLSTDQESNYQNQHKVHSGDGEIHCMKAKYGLHTAMRSSSTKKDEWNVMNENRERSNNAAPRTDFVCAHTACTITPEDQEEQYQANITNRPAAHRPSLGYDSMSSPLGNFQDEVQVESRETIVAVPIVHAELETPNENKDETETKPQVYWRCIYCVAFLVLAIGLAVVAVVALKVSDDEVSSSDQATVHPMTEPPHTPDPTTEQPSYTPKPTTLQPSSLPPTTPSPLAFVWKQLGDDIEGERAGDQFGFMVALSGDGKTVAGTAPLNNDGGEEAGSVRVFQLFEGSNNWKKKGQDLDGYTGDGSSAIALSYDGSVLAIGTPKQGLFNGGEARVLQYSSITSQWESLGSSIYGVFYDERGSSISLSKDGLTLAVGASGDDDNNGDASGSAEIFEYNKGTQDWEQVGDTISGENSGDRLGERESIKLSENGNIVAVGSRYHHNDGNKASIEGHVRVFRYNPSAYKWKQIGQDMEAENTNDSNFGLVLDISSNGKVVAVGASGYDTQSGDDSGLVQVYGYNSISDDWYQIGSDIIGNNKGDECGMGVSLSYDGVMLAIGCYQHTIFKRGELRIFHYNDDLEDWEQVGSSIQGEKVGDHFGVAVSISDDGKIVAAGGHGNDGRGDLTGHVRVYKLENN